MTGSAADTHRHHLAAALFGGEPRAPLISAAAIPLPCKLPSSNHLLPTPNEKLSMPYLTLMTHFPSLCRTLLSTRSQLCAIVPRVCKDVVERGIRSK
jgi:hypothetical protein